MVIVVIFVSIVERRWRREDDVAPLWAVDAAEPLRAVPICVIWCPRIWGVAN